MASFSWGHGSTTHLQVIKVVLSTKIESSDWIENKPKVSNKANLSNQCKTCVSMVLTASMPMLVATASIAWIFAVTAAAATAEALGRGGIK